MAILPDYVEEQEDGITPLLIFALNSSAEVGGCNPSDHWGFRLYSFQIYEDGTLQRNFVPCVSPSGEEGLWDCVEGKFYPNAGSGKFLRPLPQGYTAVEYIESTKGGGQYIDTGYTANANTKAVIDAYIPPKEQQDTTACVLFGSRTWGTWAPKAFSIQLLSMNRIRFAYNGEYVESPYNKTFDERMTITCDSKQLAWTGRDPGTASVTVQPLAQSKSTLYIFSDNSVADDGGKYDGAFNPSVMKLYSFKIIESGTLVRDFVPCVQTATHRAGLYDLVEGKFYGNAGRGEFRRPLPPDYMAVEYIESTSGGGQYINTGYTPHKGTKVVCRILDNGTDTSSDYGSIFGSRKGWYRTMGDVLLAATGREHPALLRTCGDP